MEEFKPFTIERPWGNFRQLTHNSLSTVKIISVSVNNILSLQYHNNRSEFWHIISGHPLVTVGGKIIKANPGDEFMIERLQTHRLEAKDDDVQVLEIAYGNFDEEDIIRTEDKYGRA